MAILVSTYDRSADGSETKEIRRRWTETVKSAPGTISWRVMLNTEHTTPQVMQIHEFDSVESARQWLASAERRAINEEARRLGRTSLSVQLWDDVPPLE